MNNVAEEMRHLNQLAKRYPSKRFNRLWTSLTDQRWLAQAWEQIRRNKGSQTAGVNNTTAEDVDLDLIERLRNDLVTGAYRPTPVRRVYIPKANGKVRPLGIPNLEDRIVQQGLRMLLEPIFEADFLPCSHGFRQGRSTHTALRDVANMYASVSWTIEGDIEGCFDNIPHGKLMEQVRRRIADEKILQLIWRFLEAGYLEDWKFHRTYSGTPQGGVLSPLLSNIFLHQLDELMMNELGANRNQTPKQIRARRNPEYGRICNAIQRLRRKQKAGDYAARSTQGYTVEELKQQLKSTPNYCKDKRHPCKVKYVRYADDFVVMVVGGKTEAEAGADLHARHSLDDLAKGVVINGRPVPSFEALVAAVDAAGQRAGRRLPIVIDGLNEAEDPRDWKGQLASLAVTLQSYPYVLVICTLRSAFASEALPDDLDRLEIPDFDNDTIEAIRRYFQYYRIDPADAELPWDLLRHPLTLRMFCEVTNPERKQTVGVEAMPGSLTALFDRYLEQVAERITGLAPRSRRYYESDVRTALNQIGLALWEENARSLDIVMLRRRLGDEARPWNESIVRALEHDGVLLRVPGERPSAGHVAVVFDALAGHLVADALLGEFGGRGFESWVKEPNTLPSLTGDLDKRHPLATDIFRSLVGLAPRRMHRRQLWPLLEEPSRTEAVYEAAWLEGAYLDHETVSQLGVLVVQTPSRRRDLFDRLRNTRAARFHPLNADFLDAVLRSMSIADRDLRWTEWVRRKNEERINEVIVKDLQRLEQRWQTQETRDVRDELRARWVMWTLTSTVRQLRDHATRALYWFGCGAPDALFNLALDALAVNDPYVPERMLAACYGISMSLWADPRGSGLRDRLPAFANTLVDQMFVPGAPHPTRHTLMRDYALGVISVASRVSPNCVPAEKLRYLKPPFDHLPSPFPPASEINDSDVAGAAQAIHMDFGNYTIGHLIPNRRNYNFKDTTYRDVRRQIERRIVELGYSPDRFDTADKMIGEVSWRTESRGTSKTDRYGKKYSWIAYFEMYGLRLDHGSLPEWRAGERTSDADIDPSFPDPAKMWAPPLPDLFTTTPTEPRAWIADGLTPDYEHLLHPEEVDGQHGPWMLLNAYLEQSAKEDARRIFSFLRGLLVKHNRVAKILDAFKTIKYPGNDALPELREDHYTYAGEIPWSPHFGSPLRGPNGKAKRDHRRAFVLHDGKRWLPGIPIEAPAYRFSWESYHSTLNQVSGITVPAPALCEQLRLSNRRSEWDLYDRTGHLATVYREFKADTDTFRSSFLYLRADLMTDYLARTGQTLIWFVWGERELEHRTLLALSDKFQDIYSQQGHIHRRSSLWTPQGKQASAG